LSFEELPVPNMGSVAGHRKQLNFISDILNVAMVKSLKTHIMYKANLSYRQLMSYLLKGGLLAVVTDSEDERTRFRVTKKGIQFLKDYTRLKKLLSR